MLSYIIESTDSMIKIVLKDVVTIIEELLKSGFLQSQAVSNEGFLWDTAS